MSDEPPEERDVDMLNVHVCPTGVQIVLNGFASRPFCATTAVLLGNRLVEAAGVWERTYRAFVHDETDTVH